MSASVGSCSSRSSCRCSRWSSPESFAPPSRERLRRRLSRSRNRSSASLATTEEAQKAPEQGTKLAPRHDRIEMAEAEVRLGKPEVVGKLLARRLLHDTRTRK